MNYLAGFCPDGSECKQMQCVVFLTLYFYNHDLSSYELDESMGCTTIMEAVKIVNIICLSHLFIAVRFILKFVDNIF
jgi:hypothetical protein